MFIGAAPGQLHEWLEDFTPCTARNCRAAVIHVDTNRIRKSYGMDSHRSARTPMFGRVDQEVREELMQSHAVEHAAEFTLEAGIELRNGECRMSVLDCRTTHNTDIRWRQRNRHSASKLRAGISDQVIDHMGHDTSTASNPRDGLLRVGRREVGPRKNRARHGKRRQWRTE